MLIIPILVLIIELILFFILVPTINNPDFYATIIVLINIPFVLFVLIRYGKNIISILFVGFFIRLILMYWDIYGAEIYSLPHSGLDSVGFYKQALLISADISLLIDSETMFKFFYPKFLGVLLYLGPESRIILQYINIIFIMLAILITYKMMTQFQIEFKIKKILTILMTFIPTSLIFSSILLRESLIAFLLILSIYYFIQWIKFNKVSSIVLSILFLLFASLFHGGVLSIFLGYAFMLLFYKPIRKKFQVSLQTGLVFTLLLITSLYIAMIGAENIPLFAKFTHGLETDDGIYGVVTSGRGDSTYLQGLAIDNPIELVLLTPIKMLYFILSPLPMDWRGIFDIVTFFLDSSLYGLLFLYPLFNYKKMLKGNPLSIGLFVVLLGIIMVFGIGLNNAGTATRHRFKIFFIIILFFSLSIKNKINYANEIKYKESQK